MYQRILVPLDGSELAECILPHVKAMAKDCAAKEVVLMEVIEPLPSRVDLSSAKMDMLQNAGAEAAGEYLSKIESHLCAEGVPAKSEVLRGKAAETIIGFAKQSADLVMIATHGRSGVSRLVHGNVADKILRSSCIPVLVVRAPGCEPIA